MTSWGCERSREGHQCTTVHQSPIYRRVNEQILQSDYQCGNGVQWVLHCCEMNRILLCWTALHNCVCLFVFRHISFITLRSKNKHEKEINFAAALQRALIYNRRHCTVCKYRGPPPRKTCAYLNQRLFGFPHVQTAHTALVCTYVCRHSSPRSLWMCDLARVLSGLAHHACTLAARRRGWIVIGWGIKTIKESGSQIVFVFPLNSIKQQACFNYSYSWFQADGVLNRALRPT